MGRGWLNGSMVATLLAGAATSAGLRAQAPQPEPVVGLPCEGCEAVFQGLPAAPAPQARLTPLDEPGQPMTLTGRVLDRSGRPRRGVVVYAYQTNAEGVYPRPSTAVGPAADRHGRLRGWATSDAEGRYTFETIRPGAYPRRDAPAHVHMHVIERGCATYYIDDVMFTDDPLLTADARTRLSNGRAGSGIVTPARVGGRWRVTRDIQLGQRVPGYPACGAGAP